MSIHKGYHLKIQWILNLVNIRHNWESLLKKKIKIFRQWHFHILSLESMRQLLSLEAMVCQAAP